MTSSRPGWTRLALLAALMAVSPAVVGTPTAGAASHRASVASIAAQSAVATERALAHRQSAERLLAGRERHLARCMQRHPERCARWSTAVEHAKRQVAITASRVAALRTAPVVTLSGQTITWSAVEGAQAYVVRGHSAGHRINRQIVVGTSVTPPAAAGETVEYVVRTVARDSEWSKPVTITYPANTPTPPPSGEPGSGEGSGSVPGGGSGSGSGSEPESPEKGGSGGGEVPPPPPPPPPSNMFETGLVPTTLTGSEPGIVKSLGASTVRMEFAVGAPASALAAAVEGYAKVGVKLLPLAGFYAKIPSPAEARNLASWATTYGPGGSFWAGKGYPASVAVTAIEFGNETSYTYQFGDNSPGGYAARAQAYALRFKEAEIAVREAGSTVGLLAQADDGGSGSSAWVNNMFTAVPDLASRVAGWTVHPYGPTWQKKMDNVVNFTAAKGAPGTIPIYVTELGISVDNGKCVYENYGWNPCMSNTEAAATLATVFTGMHTRYAGRLKALYLYQAQDQQPEGTSNNRESYFGVLQSNGAPKGAFTTEVQSIMASGGSALAASAARSAHIASARHHRLLARHTTRHRHAGSARRARRTHR